jgi:hypothetical protein
MRLKCSLNAAQIMPEPAEFRPKTVSKLPKNRSAADATPSYDICYDTLGSFFQAILAFCNLQSAFCNL